MCGGVSTLLDPIYLTVTEDGASGYASPDSGLSLQTVVFLLDGADYVQVSGPVTVPQDTTAEFWVSVQYSDGQPAPSPISYEIINTHSIAVVTNHNSNVIEVGGQTYAVSGSLEVTPSETHPSGAITVTGQSEGVAVDNYSLLVNRSSTAPDLSASFWVMYYDCDNEIRTYQAEATSNSINGHIFVSAGIDPVYYSVSISGATTAPVQTLEQDELGFFFTGYVFYEDCSGARTITVTHNSLGTSLTREITTGLC
jgi:hypothetical protein